MELTIYNEISKNQLRGVEIESTSMCKQVVQSDDFGSLGFELLGEMRLRVDVRVGGWGESMYKIYSLSDFGFEVDQEPPSVNDGTYIYVNVSKSKRRLTR